MAPDNCQYPGLPERSARIAAPPVPVRRARPEATDSERGEKTWLHPIEQFAGRSVLGISHENLERTRQTLGSFSAEEQEILRRFHTLPFRIVIRMSPGRLYWTLKDGALFSTGLLRALGQETTPFTPDLENDMFGAFDYVFASYAKDLGQRMYGDVVLYGFH